MSNNQRLRLLWLVLTVVVACGVGGYAGVRAAVAAAYPRPASPSFSAQAFLPLPTLPHPGAPRTPGRTIYQATCAQWQLVASPNVANRSNALYAVAALSSTNVWAVGSTYNPATDTTQALIEHWTGTTWNIVTSPSPGSAKNTLAAIAAVASNDIWAVGYWQSPPTEQQTLTEHWDGTAWRVVTSPNSSNPNAIWDALAGVTAISTNDVWAAGSYYDSSTLGYVSMTEHWNGTSWSLVPDPPTIGGLLMATASVGPSDVWAVGRDTFGVHGTAEHWNGTDWSAVSLPTWTGGSQYSLYGVGAAGANDVLAVGDGIVQSGQFQPVALHWNGTAWTFSTTPTLSGNSAMESVAYLPGTQQAWAVGDIGGSSTNSVTLIERWNGTALTLVPSPNVPGAYTNGLFGVSADAALDAWAVGVFAQTNGGPQQTLIEHYHRVSSPTGPCPV